MQEHELCTHEDDLCDRAASDAITRQARHLAAVGELHAGPAGADVDDGLEECVGVLLDGLQSSCATCGRMLLGDQPRRNASQ